MRGLQQEHKRIPHYLKEVPGGVFQRPGWEVTLVPDTGDEVKCGFGSTLAKAIEKAEEVLKQDFKGATL